MSALAIARTAMRRTLRDRTALFFLIVLPIVLIVVVGAIAHNLTGFRVGVVDHDMTPASRRLLTELSGSSTITLTRFRDLTTVKEAIARSNIDVGIVIPKGLDQDERAARPITIKLYGEQANGVQQAAVARVASILEREGARVQAALFATRYGSSFDENLLRARALEPSTAAVGLVNKTVKAQAVTLPSGYEYSAPTELVLFVFLTAITGGAALIETRKLGVLERMAAAPLAARTIIFGEMLTYLAIALVQSVLIVGIGSLAFGVSWGDPLGAGALVLLWCLVGAAAGMVAGTVFRTPEQAGAIGPIVGIAFAMLGGCMWPLAIVSPTMRLIGHFTPQAWAVDAWTRLVSSGGNIVSIWPQLGVLGLFAIALFAIASARLRHLVTSRSS